MPSPLPGTAVSTSEPCDSRSEYSRYPVNMKWSAAIQRSSATAAARSLAAGSEIARSESSDGPAVAVVSLERGRDGFDLLEHRVPVAGGRGDVGEHPQDVVVQRRELAGVGGALDLDVQERLGQFVPDPGVGCRREPEEVPLVVAAHDDHRVHDELHREAVALELDGDGVDDERHVVGDDLDDRVRRLPTVGTRGRIAQPHGRDTGLALRGQAPVRLSGSGQVFDPQRLEVVERGFGVAVDELRDARRLARRDERGGESAQSVEEIRAGILKRRRHQSEGTPPE